MEWYGEYIARAVLRILRVFFMCGSLTIESLLNHNEDMTELIRSRIEISIIIH